jgi:hypothetical protein
VPLPDRETSWTITAKQWNHVWSSEVNSFHSG